MRSVHSHNNSNNGAAATKIDLPLGQLVATPGAIEAMTRSGTNPASLLARHVAGDWGEVDGEDAAANDRAVQEGERVLSAYTLGDKTRVWVITEADRAATCILLPEEY